MSEIIVFNATRRGASHVKKDIVCQDYSLSYESDDGSLRVAIVCDGHGGDTYVRSDVGSRLAAETALANIRQFVEETPARLFLGKKGAVTSHPKDEDAAVAATGCDTSKMTEVELQRHEQDQQFLKQVADIRDQDLRFTMLFGRIYMQWLQAIEQHAEENPFNDHEQTMLGKYYQQWQKEKQSGLRDSMYTPIVKAYGSTLMAFVRTPLYWFAFHIGDGKMMACDASLNWFEPVPWDCRCFLNLTTSLCDGSPVGEFRYAFSGMGDFPVAVILGSDGLDDSWGNFERLANFYSQTLGIFDNLGKDKAVEELGDFLPKLSAKASQDDMSMAGIIDLALIKTGLQAYKKEREMRELNAERQKRTAELEKVKKEVQELEAQLAELKKKREEAEREQNNFLNLLRKHEDTLHEVTEKLNATQTANEQATENLKQETEAYNEWMAANEERFNTLKVEVDDIRKKASSDEEAARLLWQQQTADYHTADSNRRMEALQQKQQNMEAVSQQALEALERVPVETPEAIEQEPEEATLSSMLSTVEPQEAEEPQISEEQKPQEPVEQESQEPLEQDSQESIAEE